MQKVRRNCPGMNGPELPVKWTAQNWSGLECFKFSSVAVHHQSTNMSTNTVSSAISKRDHNKKAKHSLAIREAMSRPATDPKARLQFLKAEINKHLTTAKAVAANWAESIVKAEQSALMAKEDYLSAQADYAGYYKQITVPSIKECAEVFRNLPDTDKDRDSNIMTAGFVVAAGSNGCIDKFLEALAQDITVQERTRLKYKHKFTEPILDTQEYVGLQFVQNFEASTQAAAQMLRSKIKLWRAVQTIND